jgi:hypothetical protein
MPSFSLVDSSSRGTLELLQDASAVGTPPGAITSLRAMAGLSGAREGQQEVLSLRSTADALEAGDEVRRLLGRLGLWKQAHDRLMVQLQLPKLTCCSPML